MKYKINKKEYRKYKTLSHGNVELSIWQNRKDYNDNDLFVLSEKRIPNNEITLNIYELKNFL